MRLLSLLSLLIFIGCDTPEGFLGASHSIKDAIDRGVYVKEYTVSPNPYKINDSLQITVKEAWLEHQWRHTNIEEGTSIEPGGYQLCVISTEKDLKGMMGSKWSIGITEKKYLHLTSRFSLGGDFKKIPEDTLDFLVKKGSFSIDTTNIQIFGHFILHGK